MSAEGGARRAALADRADRMACSPRCCSRLLATAGFFYVNIMAALVAGLVTASASARTMPAASAR